ncbi:hypothetical protein BC829DRAFT_299285 [Chytridium lagenaria]|nr:hypothetical protein BC829DRAFT_299285 [Chytridium lagenaria]
MPCANYIFFYQKPSTLFFFILPFAHRTIIALMIGGIRNPILQISIVVVIEALHLACILAFTPYSRPIGNVLAILLSFTRCVSTGLIFPYVISESKRSPAESSTVNVAGWSFVGVQMVVVIAFIGCGVFNVVTAGFRIRETAEDSKSRGSFRSSSAMSIDPVSQTRNEAGNGDDRSQSRWTKVLSGVSFSAMSGVSTSRPDEGDERGIMETPLPAPSSASIDPRSGRGSKTPLLHHAQSYTSLGSSLNHRISVVHPPRPPSNASHVSSFMAQPRVVVPPPLQKVEGVVVTGMVNSPVTASPATRDDSGFLVSDGEGAKILSGTEIKQQSGSKRDSETIMGILKRAMSRKKSRRSRSTVKIMRPEPVDYDVEGLDSYLKEKPVGFGGMLHWRNSGDARSIRRDEDVALQDLGMRKSDSRDITGQADFVPVPPPIPAAYIVATEPVPVVPLVLPPQGVPPLASVLLVSNLPPGSRSSSPSIAGSASSFRASVLFNEFISTSTSCSQCVIAKPEGVYTALVSVS